MRKKDRLCRLEVRVAGHHGAEQLPSPLEQGLEKIQRGALEPPDGVLGEQADITRHQVVPAAPRA